MIVKQADRYLIDGPVTFDNVGTLIAEGGAFDGDRVIVDLAGVTRADSSLLSLLLEWTRLFGGKERQIVFSNLSHDLQSLADLYGVVDLIPGAPD
ncbi:MAG: STAS domain-containing protein [Betaproteobacteria bacterium]